MYDLEPRELDFEQDDRLTGFRLHRIEVFNWGTFNRQVWTMDLNGKNALLTGEIGSGKSTLVDALTALLVPAQRAAFNKAAGADTRERTLRSYVLGHYKSERSEVSGNPRPVALRDQNSYSVILASFHNAGYSQTITLAQVFWMKDMQGQPARFYAAFEGDLGITRDFANFGSDINSLRKRLRGAHVEIFDSYPPYGAWFRRRLGIAHEQALELFHQTVSMKSVGNLTDFVRNHMLEPFDVAPRIKALIEHFDDLNRAHEAVLKAKRQMEALQPLVADCDHHISLAQASERFRECREALKPFFSRLKVVLLDKRLAQLAEEYARRNAAVERLEAQFNAQQHRERQLHQSIMKHGGDRIERIEEEVRGLETERKRRTQRADRYTELARELELQPADSPELFLSQSDRLSAVREAVEQGIADLDNENNEMAVRFAQGREERTEIKGEIQSLKSRRSNIDSRQIDIRAALCAALGVSEEEMPFVGELIQVRDEERDWEGAIERHLRNFGLSLLVTSEHYPSVAEWVDKTHLRGRLVYFRVRSGRRTDPSQPQPDSLARKLTIKPDSLFYPWLESEIARRFGDVVCCSTQNQFRREVRAITRAGQIKSKGERHEKDDRYRLDDRSRYILGWSNAAKIETLEVKARRLEKRLDDMGSRLAKLQEDRKTLQNRRDLVVKLEEFRDFADLDWRPLVSQIDALTEEKKRLEASSNVLKSLKEQLEAAERERTNTQEKLEEQKDKRSRIAQRRSDAQDLRRQTLELLDGAAQAMLARREAELDEARLEALGEHQLTVESCDSREQEMRQWLQARIDAEDKKVTRLRDKIIDAMRAYHSDFPLESQEADVSVEAAGEYRAMLEKLIDDDLPRFESRFKELLNVNTINEVVNFQNQLARERETIKERIEHINNSLAQIDYNPGRYIVLETQPTQDADIRDFQSELRACTEDVLTGSDDDQYSEKKYLQVKRLIERFRGRDGQSDQDARWTARVTDVRKWFVFAASERWREDNTEYEHYSDSGGKSGGQKEKLAYTVLAASLAYQFGLEWGETRSRSFRLVVIDEAFGRGSDESAQYGLELFSRLNLQLLIVTPLQKIHIIEPFVSNVGFVHNEDGQASKLRNLSIEEYREEKAREVV